MNRNQWEEIVLEFAEAWGQREHESILIVLLNHPEFTPEERGEFLVFAKGYASLCLSDLPA